MAKKTKVKVDRTKEEQREKGTLVKDKKKYQPYMFVGHKIPQLLRGSQQHIFTATTKKIKTPYYHKYKYNDNVVSWGVTPARKLIMRGKDEGKEINIGRLNDTDLRVWNCILKIAREQVFNKGIKTNKIKITRYEIAKMLGEKKPGNTTYKMLEESLYRLANCRTELLIENEKTGEELLVSLGGYLDEYVLYDIRGRRPNAEKQLDLFTGEQKFSYVVINKRRFEEIKGGYITKISYDLLINKLSSPLSRNLYTIINVRNKTNPVILSMSVLKELTGQTDLRTHKILRSAEELKQHKFLKTFDKFKKGKQVFFRFVINTKFYDEEHKQFEIEHEPDIYYKLVMQAFNLTLDNAKNKIINEFEFEDVIKYLKFLVYEKRKGTEIKNNLGWFLKAIKDKWKIPAEIKTINNQDLLNFNFEY